MEVRSNGSHGGEIIQESNISEDTKKVYLLQESSKNTEDGKQANIISSVSVSKKGPVHTDVGRNGAMNSEAPKNKNSSPEGVMNGSPNLGGVLNGTKSSEGSLREFNISEVVSLPPSQPRIIPGEKGMKVSRIPYVIDEPLPQESERPDKNTCGSTNAVLEVRHTNGVARPLTVSPPFPVSSPSLALHNVITSLSSQTLATLQSIPSPPSETIALIQQPPHIHLLSTNNNNCNLSSTTSNVPVTSEQTRNSVNTKVILRQQSMPSYQTLKSTDEPSDRFTNASCVSLSDAFPDGSKVSSSDGSSGVFSNASISFSDASSGVLPDSSRLSSLSSVPLSCVTSSNDPTSTSSIGSSVVVLHATGVSSIPTNPSVHNNIFSSTHRATESLIPSRPRRFSDTSQNASNAQLHTGNPPGSNGTNVSSPGNLRRANFAGPNRRHWSNQSFRSDLDEVDYDRLSELSLYMVRDFRYFFQHPYLRLVIAYIVIFFNFLMYAEDPVAHSVGESSIPVIGTTFALVATKYPDSGWWTAVKVTYWLIGFAGGLVTGKLIHKYIFNRLFRLKMFHEDHGSFMTMFFTCIIFLYLMSGVYNLTLMAAGPPMTKYMLSSSMGVSNSFFMKIAATGTWCGDFFTAWMVTDMMLQEHLYPDWAKPVRRWWKKPNVRVFLFWITMPTTTFVVVLVITTDWINWDSLNHGIFPSTELFRAFLAGSIVVLDLLIVMQDWDFPHFINNFDIKLPGLNSTHIQLSLPKFLRKEHYRIHITGKWFNYGILLMVMMLDLNMWKNQIFYTPTKYGQYIDPKNQFIYTVTDPNFVSTVNTTELTWAHRSTTNDSNGNIYINGDVRMHSRFVETPLMFKLLAFLPCVLAFILFGILVAIYGRFNVNEKNPYRDRLKKKRRLLVKPSSIRHLPLKHALSLTIGNGGAGDTDHHSNHSSNHSVDHDSLSDLTMPETPPPGPAPALTPALTMDDIRRSQRAAASSRAKVTLMETIVEQTTL